MTVRNDAPIHLASRLVQVWESGASLNSCKPLPALATRKYAVLLCIARQLSDILLQAR